MRTMRSVFISGMSLEFVTKFVRMVRSVIMAFVVPKVINAVKAVVMRGLKNVAAGRVTRCVAKMRTAFHWYETPILAHVHVMHYKDLRIPATGRVSVLPKTGLHGMERRVFAKADTLMSAVFANNSVVIQVPIEQLCVHPGQGVSVLSEMNNAGCIVLRRAVHVNMDYVMQPCVPANLPIIRPKSFMGA